jgi:phage head maturation protease
MMPDGLRWQQSTAYRITKAWLRHIALVPDPAYEDAQVLAVRAATPPPAAVTSTPTPNLDRLELSRALELEAAIDARYRR